MSQIVGDIREKLRQSISACGFTLCGFAEPKHSDETKRHYSQWLAHGYGGEMEWLAKSAADRLYPERRFNWAKSVVVLALAYDQTAPAGGLFSRLSRYVYGRSYHNVMRKRLKKVEAVLSAHGSQQTKSYCDTGPVLERNFAEAAGLGWRGKNTLLLNTTWGSYFFFSGRVDRSGDRR